MNKLIDIKILIEQYLNHRSSSSENRKIVNWMRNDEALCNWLKKNIENTSNKFDEEVKVKVLENIINGSPVQPSKNIALNPFNFRTISPYWKVAIILFLMISSVLTGILFQSQFSDSPLTYPLTVKTNAGERSTVVLPDGTEVTLNSKSVISFDCNYTGGERIVHLEGEGYFDVHPDKNHAFKVITNNIEVECLGTKFNIKAYDKDDQISVVLVEGSVRVNTDESNVLLTPNTYLAYDKNTHFITQNTVNSEDYTIWRKGEIRYNNQKLKDIAEDLSRNFHVKIIIDSKEIENEVFTGYLGNTTLKNVLNVLSIASSIEYKFENDSLVSIFNKKSGKPN